MFHALVGEIEVDDPDRRLAAGPRLAGGPPAQGEFEAFGHRRSHARAALILDAPEPVATVVDTEILQDRALAATDPQAPDHLGGAVARPGYRSFDRDGRMVRGRGRLAPLVHWPQHQVAIAGPRRPE